MTFKSINPYNNEVIEEFLAFDAEKVERIIKRSMAAFKQFKTVTFEERAQLMKRAGEILRHDKAVFAHTITTEMGKPIRESVNEIEKCAWVCDYYADHAKHFLQDQVIETDSRKSYIKHQPLGPILAVMPWNYPFWQVFRFAAPALMAGNTGLLKHASNVTRCALQIEDIFRKSGFPEGCFQTLILESRHIEKLIEHDAIKAITLTGSEQAGSQVAAAAGRNIKKSVLELGGSNAFVVLDDADLERAALAGVQSRMLNTGQSCIASKRFIVMRPVAEKFIALFKEKMQLLRTGNPLDSTTEAGPLARIDLAEQLERQVTQSVSKGAKIILGGRRDHANFAPTILTDVKPGMPAFDEELFGPVAAVTLVDTSEEALTLANMSSFGLGCSVFTRSQEKAATFIEHIEDGAVFINSAVRSDPRLPFGGTKRSGYGRELSEYGIKEFINIKTVCVMG